MTLLNEFQCEALRKLGLDNIKSLMDIIEILPEYIEEPEIGRFEYELIIRKNEICYESYDVVYDNGNPFVLASFSTIYVKKCNSLLDCAFEMLKWCLKEKHIKIKQ